MTKTLSDSNTSTTLDMPMEQSDSFDAMRLSPIMRDALQLAGYIDPSPVQVGVIPPALEGIDVIAQAQTGTGKTAAFAIPILERLLPRDKAPATQAIVLVPTRELAVQVHGEFTKLARGREAYCVPIYGGHAIRQQIRQLQRGADVVVGTPGRVIDHLGRGTLDISRVSCVVLDEADRMLDIGFRPDIEKILRRAPRDRQTLLLSATVSSSVERLAMRYMRDPQKLDFSPTEVGVETIDQFYFTVDIERKFDLLLALLLRERPHQAIIFCRTRRRTDQIYRRLSQKVQRVGSIHGDMSQRERDAAMKAFRAGHVRCLVATDVVGRGIDVTSISHIINFDVPEDCDDYIHRVGRTGRMGRDGVAFTFVAPDEGSELTRIEMRIDRLLKPDSMPGFEAKMKPASTDEPAADVDPEDAPPDPLFGRGGRGRKRHRRGL
jgi:ATP-dependent RNA helicase DeaD